MVNIYLINNVSYYLDEPIHGDIIVFQHPRNDLNLIKRVIGVPGDHIVIRERQVMVNDNLLEEPYIQAAPTYSGEWTVPEDTYFVLGDNRNNSSDSHQWDYLPDENILGKAMIVYWPPTDWTTVPHYAFPILELQPMNYQPDEIKALVREIVERTIGDMPTRSSPTSNRRPSLLTAFSKLPIGSSYPISSKTIVTPLAQQIALERQIRFITADPNASKHQQSTAFTPHNSNVNSKSV